MACCIMAGASITGFTLAWDSERSFAIMCGLQKEKTCTLSGDALDSA